MAAGTIVSYYHGLRMKAAEENPFGAPTGYAIYLEWDRERRENSDVLDISPEVRVRPQLIISQRDICSSSTSQH